MYAAIPANNYTRAVRARPRWEASAARLLKLDCPGFLPGRSYKSRGELSSSKQDRSQKAPTSRTTSSVGAEKHPPTLTLSCFCSHVIGFFERRSLVWYLS